MHLRIISNHEVSLILMPHEPLVFIYQVNMLRHTINNYICTQLSYLPK